MDLEAMDIARFGHFLGVVLLAAATGVEWTSLRLIRRASTVEDLRRFASVGGGLEFVFPFASVLILASGVYMVEEYDAWSRAWVLTTLGAFIAMGVLGAAIASRRLKAIEGAAESATTGLIAQELIVRTIDPVLWTTEFLLAAWLLGIIMLKVLKPEIAGALGIIAGSTVVGVATALVSSRGSLPATKSRVEVTGAT